MGIPQQSFPGDPGIAAKRVPLNQPPGLHPRGPSPMELAFGVRA